MQTTAMQTTGGNNLMGSNIVSRTGNVVGKRFVFGGQGKTAKELKESLRAGGLKGNELTAKVNEILRGEKTLREQVSAAMMQMAIQEGYIADGAELRKTTGVIRLVKPAELRVKKEKPAKLTADVVKGMTQAERDEILALLLAK